MITHDVEQGSEAWYSLRAGIPTGSRFSSLITGTGKISDGVQGYAIELAGEKMAGSVDVDGYGGFSTKHTERGKRLEPEARSTYELNQGVEVETVGFITDDYMRYGVSPDGLVGKHGLVEYKCLTSKEFIEAALYYKQTGRCQPKYISQTQGSIMVSERSWCDFVIYHPLYPLIVIRQQPNLVFQELLLEQIEAVEIERNLIIKDIESL